VTPNPSIEATNNGVQRLRAFAQAVPPLFAPHLKRWAAQARFHHFIERKAMSPNLPTSWNWRDEGFWSAPVAVVATRPANLYRVWGGTSSEAGSPHRPGICLSFHAPKTRKEAEGLFSVFEWGNACRFATRFEVAAGATLYIGKAHPGDYYHSGWGHPGSQVFIELAQFQRLARKIGQATNLIDDLKGYTVVPNRDPGRKLSS